MVVKAMRDAPVHDVFTDNGKLREDGRFVYDRYLVKVKKPEESKYPWDYLSIVAKIPADAAFRPLGSTGCNLVDAAKP